MSKTTWTSKYFCGNEVSEYGQEHKRIDYATLAKSFQHVLNNEIIGVTGWDAWDIENGDVFDENDNPVVIYQYYIISDNGADILKTYTNEIVLYNNEFGMYMWGVTHYGTSWSYVLTDIKLDLAKEA